MNGFQNGQGIVVVFQGFAVVALVEKYTANVAVKCSTPITMFPVLGNGLSQSQLEVAKCLVIVGNISSDIIPSVLLPIHIRCV